MHFEIYKDHAGEWRWTLYAANNRKVADSGEGYHNKADCLHGIDLVRSSATAPVRERPAVTYPFGFAPPKG